MRNWYAYEADEMMAHTVDPRVGSVRNNEPALCAPWDTVHKTLNNQPQLLYAD